LVTVGGDLFTVLNENDQTFFANAGHNPEDNDLRQGLIKGAIWLLALTSDTGRSVKHLLLQRLIRALAMKSFSSKKMQTLKESQEQLFDLFCSIFCRHRWS
jgi:hypothetical protein